MLTRRGNAHPMNKGTIRSVAAIFGLAGMLAGCGGPAYVYEGQRYESTEAMFAAQSANQAEVMAAVTPLPALITRRKLILAIPSQSLITDETLRRARVL